MTVLLALDPGPTQTGWVTFDGVRVVDCGVDTNAAVLAMLQLGKRSTIAGQAAHLAIEMIASYGMPVGREVFETCVMIGEFRNEWRHTGRAEAMLVYRVEVKKHLCGKANAKDPNVRQALIDLFPRTGGGATPQIGTKHCPGPLYGVATHVWPALGVAVVAAHKLGTLKVQTEGPLFEPRREVAFP